MNSWKLACIVLAVGLAGCQAPPPLNFSVPDVGVSSKKIDAELRSVTVTLGRPDEKKGNLPMGAEGITQYWKESLQEAVDRMAIFRDRADNTVSIQVKILAVDVPSFGVSFTTKTVARYELIDRSNGSIIYTQDVAAEGVVPAGYAFAGITRARESINRSAQNNIKQFLQSLEEVDVEKPMFPSQQQ